MSFARASVAVFLQLFTVISFAGGRQQQSPVPECMDGRRALSEMNQEVLDLRTNKPSGYKARALVQGQVEEVYADSGDHLHFSIRIGKAADDRIEVVYNTSFGRMPIPQKGEEVIACGDYIVSTSQNGKFPPSPDGAIIHWVHQSPGKGHDHGFVHMSGVLYGFGGATQARR